MGIDWGVGGKEVAQGLPCVWKLRRKGEKLVERLMGPNREDREKPGEVQAPGAQ